MASIGVSDSGWGPTEGRSSASEGMPWATRRAISTTSDQTADAVPGQENRIEDPGDGGQRRGGRDHRGVHAHLDAAATGGLGGLGNRQQLDAVAQLARVVDVRGGDTGDAL